MSALDRASDSLQRLYDRGTDFAADHRTIVSVLGAGTAVALGLHFLRVRDYRRKPGTGSLSGGSIPPTKLRAKYKDYEEAYSGGTITDRTRTTELVRLDPCFCFCTGSLQKPYCEVELGQPAL